MWVTEDLRSRILDHDSSARGKGIGVTDVLKLKPETTADLNSLHRDLGLIVIDAGRVSYELKASGKWCGITIGKPPADP